MNLLDEFTPLTRASDIVIPPEYFNRLRTGNEHVDAIFGDGILPGSTFTIAAPGGVGKSIFLLQLCSMLVQNYRVAYLSGEENIYMVALAARRVNSSNAFIAAESRLSVILKAIEEHDLVIIDSFPCLVYDLPDADDYSDAKKLVKCLEAVSRAAKASKCAVGFILHMTKSGQYKGTTDLNHAVEANIFILRDGDDPDIRVIETRKNRLGPCGEWRFGFGFSGYDFSKVVEVEEEVASPTRNTSRGNARNNQLNQVLEMVDPPLITLDRVCKHLDVDAQRAKYLLWLLVSQGKLVKYGRGPDTIWKVVEVEDCDEEKDEQEEEKACVDA